MRFFRTFATFIYPLRVTTKAHEIFVELSLTDFMGFIMYAKIRAKNWATLFEIDSSEESKIKSVAQFYLTLMRMPDWKTTVIFSSECTSMKSRVRSIRA